MPPLHHSDCTCVRAEKGAKKDLKPVDHSTIDYVPFTKNFWIEPKEIAKMTDDEVSMYRLELDNIRIKGKGCPRPIKTWNQCALPMKMLRSLSHSTYHPCHLHHT